MGGFGKARAALNRIIRDGVTSAGDLQALLAVPGYSQWAQSPIVRNLDATIALRGELERTFGITQTGVPILNDQGVVSLYPSWEGFGREALTQLTELADRYGVPIAVRGGAALTEEERSVLAARDFVPYVGLQEQANRRPAVLFSMIRPAGGIPPTTPLFSQQQALADDLDGAGVKLADVRATADRVTAALSEQQRADLLAAELMTAAREHLAGRTPQVRSMVVDAQQQARWLNRQAVERGYENADALALDNFDVFEGLTAQWRERHQTGAMLARSLDTKARFEARIDELFAGAKPLDVRRREPAVKVLDRSDMLALLRMSDGPVYLKESAVRKPESGMPRGTAPKHPNMTAEQWKKVPQWLEAPAAVFDSDTVPGALVAIGPELVNGAVVMLTIEPRSEGPDRGVTISLLTNAYDKDKGPPPMGRWLREGKAWYVDKKKFPDVLRRVGLQLPDTAYQNKPGTRKILTERNLDGYLKANPPLLSRTAVASPQQQPALTPSERADELTMVWAVQRCREIVGESGEGRAPDLPHPWRCSRTTFNCCRQGIFAAP